MSQYDLTSNLLRGARLRRATRCDRRAFTLVEVLVVVAIIGIVIAILLPAVVSARAIARRMQCLNNLKQIGLALHDYHDTNRVFPVGNTWGKYWSFQTHLLPYLEQQALYDQVDFNARNCFYATSDAEPNSVASQRLSVLECPGDPLVGREWSSPQWGSYVAGSYFGVMGSGRLPPDAIYDGMLFRNSGVAFKHVKDGTSYTLFVGERGAPKQRNWGWWACGSGNKNRGDGDNLLSTELGLTKGGVKKAHLFHFWSNHKGGGANFLFVDGSCRFLSNEIALQTFLDLSTRAGEEIIQSL